jgi:hypothetical protein
MEEETKKRKKREPRAWLFEDGVKKELVVPKPTKLSAAGVWRREHPIDPEWIKQWDMRAVLK